MATNLLKRKNAQGNNVSIIDRNLENNRRSVQELLSATTGWFHSILSSSLLTRTTVVTHPQKGSCNDVVCVYMVLSPRYGTVTKKRCNIRIVYRCGSLHWCYNGRSSLSCSRDLLSQASEAQTYLWVTCEIHSFKGKDMAPMCTCGTYVYFKVLL